MKMSEKQKNAVRYGASNVGWHCGQEARETLLSILDKDFDPYDAGAIVSCVFDLEKDEREGFTEEMKKKTVAELKELIRKYADVCPRCRKTKEIVAGLCADCYGEIGDSSYRSTNNLMETYPNEAPDEI